MRPAHVRVASPLCGLLQASGFSWSSAASGSDWSPCSLDSFSLRRVTKGQRFDFRFAVAIVTVFVIPPLVRGIRVGRRAGRLRGVVAGVRFFGFVSFVLIVCVVVALIADTLFGIP